MRLDRISTISSLAEAAVLEVDLTQYMYVSLRLLHTLDTRRKVIKKIRPKTTKRRTLQEEIIITFTAVFRNTIEKAAKERLHARALLPFVVPAGTMRMS